MDSRVLGLSRWVFVALAVLGGVFALMRVHVPVAHAAIFSCDVATKTLKQGVDDLDMNCKYPDSIYDCFKADGSPTCCSSLTTNAADRLTSGVDLAVANSCIQYCQRKILDAKSLTDLTSICARCTAYASDTRWTALAPIVGAYQLGGGLYACTAKGRQALANKLCDKGPKGCCIADVQGQEEFHVRKETCEDGSYTTNYYYGDCFCVVNGVDDPKALTDMSPQSCEDQCVKQGGHASTNRGIGRYLATDKSQNADTQSQYIDTSCFTQDECADPQYGGSADAFVPSSICPTGKGRCLAPEPDIALSSPILGVKTVKGLKNYIVLAFRFLLSIVVITAAVMFVYGGFKYILGATAGGVESAKDTMVNAVIGMVVAIGATTLLNTINPETTNLNRLNIYLIKPIQYGGFNWCSQYTPQTNGSKAVKFADAGNPAGSVSYNAAKFTLDTTQTTCGASFYPEGFGGKTCDGDICPSGRVCLACKDGTNLADCASNPKGFACVRAVFAGNVTWSDEKYPTDIRLVPVCNYIQPLNYGEAGYVPFTLDSISNNTPNRVAAKLDISSSDAGKGSYLITLTPDQLKKITDACNKPGKDYLGGTRGFLLAVQYKDAVNATNLLQRKDILLQAAKSGFVKGATGQGDLHGLGFTSGLIGAGTNVLKSVVSANDVAIVAKYNCTNSAAKTASGSKSSGLFPGYADGTRLSLTDSDITTAMYCGYSIRPLDTYNDINAYRSVGRTPAFDQQGDATNPYFSYDEVEKAVNGGSSVKCDLELNNGNAPPDPGTMLMGCCSAGGTLGSASSWSTLSNADNGTRLWCSGS